MGHRKCTEALEFIQKLRGGSQPILVKASDGFLYVVKFLDNLQGPNVPFNEALGTQLFRQAGLPAPEWSLVQISEDFLNRNPECWLETEHGWRRPKEGLCFGSRFLNSKNGSLFEILPQSYFSRIRNRRDFTKAWVLDVLCGHSDNRQAIFVQGQTKWLEAHFIDHGHLFGGADGLASPVFWASQYLDPDIYGIAGVEDAWDIENSLHEIDLTALADTIDTLPSAWKTAEALCRFELFRQRMSDPLRLRNTIHLILGLWDRAGESYDRDLSQSAAGPRRTNLYTKISKADVFARNGGRGCYFVGGER
jgi:hypothetical protein